MKKEKEPVLTPLLTRWGETLDKELPHNDYPRPQLKRAAWICLNGAWEYAIREGDAAPQEYAGSILVPFSPECLLSGVQKQVLPGQKLWYRRGFTYVAQKDGARTLLHFGAVDQRCTVYCNGVTLGTHEGGYWPFSFDVTDFLRAGENTVVLCVTDDADTGTEAYGKQRTKRGGIWYTPQSGIWQTVWLETVPRQYITALSITPMYDEAAVDLSLAFWGDAPAFVRVNVLDGEAVVASGEFAQSSFRISLPGFKSWSPDSPFLYALQIEAGEDKAESYFGMRKFSAGKDARGKSRFFLNNEPLFMTGLLDQGYWSDGMYTPPSDEAMAWEIETLKNLGFNMLRKHIKIEPLRFYYHCDRLGMLVWQDFVNGGGPYRPEIIYVLPHVGARLDDTKHARFGRNNSAGRAAFERDMERTVTLLRSVVSLAVWVPFNEGWGQFDAHRIAEELNSMDNTRIIDHASGYYDQRAGDIVGPHVYFKRYRLKEDPLGRVRVLSEFGGYSLPIQGHMASRRQFGYRLYKTEKELNAAYEKLYREEVLPAAAGGLCACVYTQVSDVEDELNGLFTYDRVVLKADAQMVREMNRLLKESVK